MNRPNAFISGGAPAKNTDVTRADAEYFFDQIGIDLDILLQLALLSCLAPGTNLVSDTELPHPNIDWTPTRLSGRYLYRPDNDVLDAAVRSGRELVIVVDKKNISQLADKLSDYKCTCHQSIGDLMLVHAIFGNSNFEFVEAPTDWLAMVDVTESWGDDLKEKIIEDGYMHHLGCIETSPYLTQL